MDERTLHPSSVHNFSAKDEMNMDKDITKDADVESNREPSFPECVILLGVIVAHSCNKLRTEYEGVLAAKNLLTRTPLLHTALKRAWKTQDYREIRNSALLQPPKHQDYDEPLQVTQQKRATEKSWSTPYIGEAPKALWFHIKAAMAEPEKYARYSAISQSSGTGKSRLVDKLGEEHLVIPINFRPGRETGFPPPDRYPRSYLQETSRIMARIRAVTFLKALFEETREVITALTSSQSYRLPSGYPVELIDLPGVGGVAASFHQFMSYGMSWGSHGPCREIFYQRVLKQAEELERNFHSFIDIDRKLGEKLTHLGMRESFDALANVLYPTEDNGKSLSEPLVVLAFDEIREFAKPVVPGYQYKPWYRLDELCLVLREINDRPLFTLFVSTTATINESIHPSTINLEFHSIRQLSTIRPFTEVGFDQFAVKNCLKLEEITSDEHISHFGRPLWATRYDCGGNYVKSNIVSFGAMKLRAGGQVWESLELVDKLACMAQRLPIEFNSERYNDKVKELELVEGHMRILLHLDAEFESVTTLSASEPLLSEAAYMLMTNLEFNLAKTLEECLSWYAIKKSDHGELLIMLLFTLARDNAIGDSDYSGQPSSGHRWCSIPNFMNALFKDLTPDMTSALQSFADSKIFFSHWVKVHEHGLVNVEWLAQLMCRGTAMWCCNHPSIDGIIPILHASDTLSPDKISVLLWQATNDTQYQSVDTLLFEAMNPYDLGIFDEMVDVPIIRVVFALSSREPCLKIVSGIGEQQGLRTLDIWVGGISPGILQPVGNDENIWRSLLKATYRWQEIYERNVASYRHLKLRQSMTPGVGADPGFWENWTNLDENDFPEEDHAKSQKNTGMDAIATHPSQDTGLDDSDIPSESDDDSSTSPSMSTTRSSGDLSSES